MYSSDVDRSKGEISSSLFEKSLLELIRVKHEHDFFTTNHHARRNDMITLRKLSQNVHRKILEETLSRFTDKSYHVARNKINCLF